MTAPSPQSTAVTTAPDAPATTVVVSWKVPIVYAVVTLLAIVLFIVAGNHAEAVFRISTPDSAIQVPELAFNGFVGGVVSVVLLAAATVVAALLVRARRRVPLWLTVVFAIVFVVGFLGWAAAGGTTSNAIPLFGLVAGGFSLAVPLIYGAMAGVISERVGVVNIAIEGQLLAGAFTAAVVATITGQPIVGMLAAAVAGVLVSFVLAAFAIKYLVDQVIVGVVLNVLVVGLTSFLFSQLLAPNKAALNSPPRLDVLPIPGLSEIPLIGPMLFRQTIVVYLVYVVVAAVYIGLFHTRWGLRLRAVGEHPEAADTVGINIPRTRFWNVSLGGAIAGLGGSFFTVGSVGAFNQDMTAGAGYIALAAVIFGGWDPIRATLAALLFGFTSNLRNTLGAIGSPIPSEFLLMLPYVVTIFAVAGLVGVSRGPAAAGKPYIKG
ncbi:ABC transporter permease [Microbacterium sp. 10M-3C3]|jgi:simple sugar transport system permease protein|uniref:ABC transporter permease n=1 Tax=Microbacterium sp. 10M-3C3 TaxID=2483401 RepID=UPI000F63919C|nr:ABC transporter permease [Microbacterium sp. 10M-3C3]